MRLFALLGAVIAALSFGSMEASAAGSHWACNGGYVACGSPKKAAFKASKKKNKSYSKKSYKKKTYAKSPFRFRAP